MVFCQFLDEFWSEIASYWNRTIQALKNVSVIYHNSEINHLIQSALKRYLVSLNLNLSQDDRDGEFIFIPLAH